MSEESVGSSTPNVGTSSEVRRVRLTDQQLDEITLEELTLNWHEQDSFIDYLECRVASHEASLHEAEERLRRQHLESTRRENMLVRRLATKEQEVKEYANQISEFRAGQSTGSPGLRSALLDPAVNLLLQSLRGEIRSIQTRLEETQNELNGWKFSPDSVTGKRLMAKCRLLYQENEELGRMISSGRLAKLEGELALQKSFSEEVNTSQSALDEFFQDMEDDVEGMQSTNYSLQQELRKSKEDYINLQKQFNSLPSEAISGFMLENEPSTSRGQSSTYPSVEVTAGPEPCSLNLSSSQEDEPCPPPLFKYAGCEVCVERTTERRREVDSSVSEAPSSTSGEGYVALPLVTYEDRNDVEGVGDNLENITFPEVPELVGVFENYSEIKQCVLTYSEVTEMNEVVENGNRVGNENDNHVGNENDNRVGNENDNLVGNENGDHVGNENKEETNEQDSRGELMIEGGSELIDIEDEEECCEKNKTEEEVVTVGSTNGVIHYNVVGTGHEGEEENIGLQRKKKRHTTESSQNPSDDSPPSYKIFRHHCERPSQ